MKNKNEFDNLVGMSDSISDAYKNKVKFVYDSLPHKKSAVNEKLSDRDPDAVKVNHLLQKQNAELRETVGYLKELVRLQGKVTDGTVYFDIAEIALSALGRQYIANNRISDLPSLRSLLEPWAVARNFAQKGVAWHFTTDDARTKLKHLYVFPDIFL